MFSEKDLIESNTAGAGPAPVLDGVDSDEDDLAALDEEFAGGLSRDEDEEEDGDLEDEFDVEDDEDADGLNGCAAPLSLK